MRFWIILSIIDIALYIVLAILVLKVWNFGKAQRRFFFLLLTSVVWLTMVLLEAIIRNNLNLYEWINRIDFSFAALVAYFFLLFALHFPRTNQRLSKTKELILFVPIFFAISISLSGYVFTTKDYSYNEYNTTVYILYITILFFYFLIVSVTSLYYKFRKAVGLKKLQIKYFVIGYMVSIVGLLYLSVQNALVDRISDEIFLPLVSIALVFPLVTAYTILRYRLMDISFVIRRGLVHIISFVLIITLYTLFILLAQDYLELEPIQTTFVIVLVIAVTIYPLRKRLFIVIDRLFYKDEIKREEEINELVNKLPSVREYDQILQEIYSVIIQNIKTTEVRILILNKEKGVFEIVYPIKNAKYVSISETLPIVRYLSQEKVILVREEIPYLIDRSEHKETLLLKDLQIELNSLKADVLITLKDDRQLIGMVLIGHKKHKEAYTVQDIDFLKNLSSEAGVGLTNVLFYKQTIERLKRDIEKGKIG